MKTCPECGKENRESAAICHFCGEALPASPAGPSPAGPAPFGGGEALCLDFAAHEGAVNCVAILPDGSAAASGGEDGKVKLWSRATRSVVATWLPGGAVPIGMLAVSADGKWLAAGDGGGEVRVFMVPSGDMLAGSCRHAPEGAAQIVVFARDGSSLLTGGEDGRLKCWSLPDRAPLGELEGHEGGVSAAAFSPSGKTVLSAGADGRVCLWSLAKRAPIISWTVAEGECWAVGFSRDGKRAMAVLDRGVLLQWDLASGKRLEQADLGFGSLYSLELSADGGIVVATRADGLVSLRRNGDEDEALDWDTSGSACVADVSVDGSTAVCAGGDSEVRFLDTGTGREIGRWPEHEGELSSAAMSPDGKTLACTGARSGILFASPAIELWDMGKGELLNVVKSLPSKASALAFSPDGRLLAAGLENGGIHLWKVPSGEGAGECPAHRGRVFDAAFSPDGAFLATCGADMQARVFDSRTFKEVGLGHASNSDVLAAAFLRDGGLVAFGNGEGTILVWDFNRGRKVLDWKAHKDWVRRLALDPASGLLVSGGGDGQIRVWNHENGEVVESWAAHAGAVLGLELAADGSRLVSIGEDGAAAVWRRGERGIRWDHPGGPAHCLAAASGGGNVFTAGKDGRFRLWDISAMRRFNVHRGPGAPLPPGSVPDPGEDAGNGESGVSLEGPGAAGPQPLEAAEEPRRGGNKDVPGGGAPCRTTRVGDGGVVLAGKFELVRRIGEGGMGVVYEGLDHSLERAVAIKKMRPELRLSAREKRNFLKEAKTAASLHHPFIVDIYAILEEADEVYLVFEYVDGLTLEEALEERDRMEWPALRPVLKGVCDALSFAHSRRVIHRDLKPSNIMVTAGGYAKVMDFGIARQMKDTVSRLTKMDTSGTLAYMAPEQELGRFDVRSDLYSLAATLYEVLSGGLPFPGPNFLAQKERMTFRPLRETLPDLPPGPAGAIERCLRFDPRERFETVAEFAAAAGLGG